MKLFTESNESRRELFRTLGRILALGCLTILSAMAMKKETGLTGQETCWNFTPCGECQRLGSCTLPQAQTAQRTVKEADDAR